jgi:DNA end-binding protein Ku
MPRALWSGAISFGLVYIPVSLYSATRGATLNLDFLDKRDFSPVGYQRINKRTGKPVEWSNIVRGYPYQKGSYVALSEEDFRRANVKASRTIDILGFTDVANIEPRFYDTPYHLLPNKGGEKVYVLLREALRRTGKAGIAQVVIRTRQHLAAVLADERLLTLNTLRFADELQPPKGLELPDAGMKKAGLSSKELAMAERLIAEMTIDWKPEQYHDTYREDLMARIKEKVRARQTHSLPRVTREGREEEPGRGQVIDLMSALRRSLEKGASKPTASSGKRATVHRLRSTQRRRRTGGG